MICLVHRKPNEKFKSIENVFSTLFPFLEKTKKIELPYESRGGLRRLLNIIFLFKSRSSVIHITGHDHYLLWFPFKRSILTIHDVEALKRKKGLKKWVFKKLWFDLPIKNATVVTTISEFSKQELLEMQSYQTPIEVIHNPLTIEVHDELKEFNIDQPRILQIGTKANKNILRLVKAVQGINCTLVIIGDLPNTIKQILKESQISYENYFNLTEDEVKHEYLKSDLLAFVSTYEGFGLPIIEAQAAGIPVLTSNCSSMPEVGGEGALLVNPFDVEDIRLGILKIISDDSLRIKLINQGKKNIERFDAKMIAKNYQTLYDKIQL